MSIDLKDAFARIKDPILIFIVVIVVVGVGAIVTGVFGGEQATTEMDLWIVAELLGAVIILALAGLWIYLRYQASGYQRRADEAEQRIAALQTEIETLENAEPMIQTISRADYGKVLGQWNACGPGAVVLYNIELERFATADMLEKTWGGLKKLKNIQRVHLLLPPEKMRRFEDYVLASRHGFFADPENHKFYVSEMEHPKHETEQHRNASAAVAFAMYHIFDEENNLAKKYHSKVVMFILSEPFSDYREALPPQNTEWWDYRYILGFNDEDEITASAVNIWNDYIRPDTERNIARVLQDTEPLEPIEPERLFDELGMTPPRKDQLLPHLDPRHRANIEPFAIPLAESEGSFSITYDNGQAIRGRYAAVDTIEHRPKPCVVWVGGFTERQHSKLPDLFERQLRKEDVVQFFYEVSPPVPDVTLTRYMQDMDEVLRYVNQQNVVVPNRIVLVARSINALVAALVASKPDILPMLRGVILVAPVFDLISMINNYRRLTGTDYVTVERCWRRSPGYPANQWENPARGWLEFFSHDVNLSLMADIIRHPEPTFRLPAFVDGVGEISQRCPVYVLSHPEDPITGSAEARAALDDAASGGGLIKTGSDGENGGRYDFIEIESLHFPPTMITKNRYPFAVKDEIAEVRRRLADILVSVDLPTRDVATEVAVASGVHDRAVGGAAAARAQADSE
jgi:acetyl esterase/lipase